MVTRLGSSTQLNLRHSLGALVVMTLLAPGAATAQTTLVTAVRDGSGNLKLISWNQNGVRLNGQGASAGAVSLISAVRLGTSDRMVTAVRDGGGNLKVIPWAVTPQGVVSRLPGDGQAGAVSVISATSNPRGDRVVTAVRDGDGNLKVIAWAVTPQGTVTRLQGDGQAGAVSVISATFIGFGFPGTLLATAVRDGSGNLKIITWRVATGGVSRLKEASGGAVSEISAVQQNNAQQTNTRLLTAVRDGGGNLKVIEWTVDAAGNIARGKEGQAGAATRISAFRLISPRIATAVRDGAGNLKVISWEVSPTTNKIERRDDESAGAVSLVSGSLCGFDFAPPNVVPFQTSVRDGSGDLKIITWRSTLQGTAITRFPGGEASAGAVSLISTVCFS